ncbi:hypothetical protein NFI96_017223 [Prochilodus magdalenae]|nr:hypothetical protein NFI96_017223 [Prochilodus magdalenae]
MTVNPQNTSLTILSVSQSDSGLYYCSVLQRDHLTFSNTTHLQIKDVPDAARCDVLFVMVLIFGAVIVILLSVLVFVIVRNRTRGETNCSTDQDQDPVNYAALQFSNKKSKKTGRQADMNMDPHILYSSIRL